eukprot:TRINITY_DN2042_c0_g1_i1.p1 TRINITY_DN2042_c0_g1~~TRINITY_DN2042_c0_g1_i1.p1  ORF type:complete len:259 (-),score=21.40 TRINITY_DN2042_c0_g1_i1:123-899(-)
MTELNLHSNKIGPEGIRFLLEHLHTNTTITSLNLNYNVFQVDGAIYTSDMLRSNTTITQLYLTWNQVGAEGTNYLSKSLMANTTLTELDISGNHIENEGALYISECMMINSKITKLNLARNDILGGEGYKHISNFLMSNNTLTQLHLSELDDVAINFITEALNVNTSLLTLQCDYITESGNYGDYRYFDSLLERNMIFKMFSDGWKITYLSQPNYVRELFVVVYYYLQKYRHYSHLLLNEDIMGEILIHYFVAHKYLR